MYGYVGKFNYMYIKSVPIRVQFSVYSQVEAFEPQHVSIKKKVLNGTLPKMKVRDPSGTYPFLVKYGCYISTNFMVFSVSQVVWGLMQGKRAGKR